MGHGRLECLLDSIQLFRAQVDELIQQQHHLCWVSIDRMLALADLPVSISSVKRRKGSTRYFPTNEAEEQCRNVGGKENNLAGGSVVVGCPQLKSSTKASAKSSRRRRKPLVDSQVVNQSGQLDTSSSICTRIADGGEFDQDLALQQQQRGNEGLFHSVERGNEGILRFQEGNERGNEGNKSTFLAGRGKEELTHSMEEKRSMPTSVSPIHVIVAGEKGEVREAEESLPDLEKPRTTSSVPIGGGPSQTKTEVGPDLGAPRLTRNRARILQNAGANVTIARGEPPLKKRRGRKGNVNSSDSPAAAEEDGTAGKIQTAVAETAMEQQSRDEPPSRMPPAVQKRNTRSSSRSPAERNGEVGKMGATCKEQDVKVVKVQNEPPKISGTAEEGEEVDIGEERPCKKSRPSLGSTRLNSSSQVEANDALEFDKMEDAKANARGSVEDHNPREVSVTERSRERNGNARVILPAAPVEIDGKFEAVGISQSEVLQRTAADDQPVNRLPPLEERNGMESHQSNMITPSSQDGNVSDLRINCGSAKISEVDLANPDLVNALRADRGHLHDCTELRSEFLASAEDPPEFLLREGAYRGSRRTTLLLSPPLKSQFVEREADVIVLNHSELKDEDISSISEVPAEEQMEENNLREGHPRRFSNPLAETDASPGRSTRTVAHSAGEHSLTLELNIRKSRLDAIGGESAVLQLPAVLEANEWIEETKESIPLAEASISPRDREGELHKSPGTALELPESVDASEGSILPRQPPQSEITHRNSAGTPVRRERQLTELVTAPELEGEELVDEESDGGRREKRLTLLVITPEVLGDNLVDEEADAVVPCSQLKSTEENHLLETSAMGHIQGGPNSQATSDISYRDDRREEVNVIIPPAVDVNPSVGREGRMEPTGILENWQMNVSHVMPSVQKWDKSRLLEIGENKSLVATLSSFGRATPASVNDDHHRAYNVGVLRNTDPSCEPREDGNEVGTIVSPSEQASKRSKALESYQIEGIAPVNYARPTTNMQYSSELRLSRLVSTKQVGVSWTVADPGEDDKNQSRIMKPERLGDAQEESGGVSGILVKGQSQWTSKLDLVGTGANKPMPFPIDESSVSLQNMKATDLLLELWKRGGMQGSGLAAHHGPSSSEPAGRNYKFGVVDEVYRSVVVRECGGNGAGSTFTVPIGNWSSGIVCNMTGASSQFGPRVMERSLPLRDVLEAREMAEVDSQEDRKSDQERTKIWPSLLLIKDQDQDVGRSTQDSVYALTNSGAVECSQEMDIVSEVSPECECRVIEQLLSHEDLNMSKPIPLSRVEEDHLAVSSLLYKLEDRAVPVVDPACSPIGPVDNLQQVVSSNIVSAEKPFSNLIKSMRSFVPVVQQPPPSFMPDGKRIVKVKALIAAEAARRAEGKKDVKDRLRKMRRAEGNASSGNEQEEAVEASIAPKESVEGSKLDGGENSCGSHVSPRKKVSVRSNSRNLFSPEAKPKQATNLEIGKKVKKNLAELKRMEEERKRKLLVSRQLKEQLVQKKMEKRQEDMKQKREQKLAAEQEDKAQRLQASEEAEREKKAMEEKAKGKQCTPRPREVENLQGDELKVKGAGQGVLQTRQARPGQAPGKIRSNLLGSGPLPLRSAVRVPVVSKDKRTPAIVAAAIQKKGRHPSSSSSSRLLSLNAEPARFTSLNAESARFPSVNAEPARKSSLTAECAAEGVPRNSTHAFSLDNRPADVRQGGSGDSVSCIDTPCSRAVEKEEDLGPMSYEISPYRGSSDEEEDEREQPRKPAKHIPFWARKENLNPHLLKQLTLDPDEIFSGWKTCSLKEVFGKTGSQKIQDFGKRSGSGDWFKDRVSWKEELQYKIGMGYMQQKYP